MPSTTSFEIRGYHFRDSKHLGFSNAVGPCASVGTGNQVSLKDSVVDEPFRDSSHLGFSNAVGPCVSVGTDQKATEGRYRWLGRENKRYHSATETYGSVAKFFKQVQTFYLHIFQLQRELQATSYYLASSQNATWYAK